MGFATGEIDCTDRNVVDLVERGETVESLLRQGRDPNVATLISVIFGLRYSRRLIVECAAPLVDLHGANTSYWSD